MAEKKEKKGPTPFDFVKVILESHEQMPITNAYNMYIVNRAVAHHRDNIYSCQLLNEFQPDNEQHYNYLFNKINKHRRRFERWVSSKKANEDLSDVEVISKYYQCSLEVARQYLPLHTEADLALLRSVGGGRQ